MEVYQVNQMVVGGCRKTAAALRLAVSVMTNSHRNHGTLGWHCQHLASLDLSATVSSCIAMFVFHTR